MNSFHAFRASLEAGLPVFALHTLVTLGMLFALTWLYNLLTINRPIAEIAGNNIATAISSGSVLISFSIPLSFCLAGSVNVFDIVVWGIPLGLSQIAVFWISEWIFRSYPRKETKDAISVATYIASLRLGVAFIFAGAIMG